jgi:hypothetical protein
MAITAYAGSVPSTLKKNKVWTLWSTFKASTVSAGATQSSYATSKIKYNNGFYYFITNNGYVYYSSDSKSWSTSTRIAAVTGWTDIAYNGTIWVAVGGNSSTMFHSSTDLTTWTLRTSNIHGTGQIYQVDWIPAFSRFIAVGNADTAPWNCISSSTDGTTWTSAAVVPNAGANSTVWGFAYDGTGTIVASGNNATNNGYYTTNGTSWTSININNGVTNSYKPIWIGGSVSRFIISTYSQTAASVATAWATAPTTNYSLVTQLHYGLVNDSSYGQKADLVTNTIDNVVYAYQPYTNGTGGINLPELKTFDIVTAPIVYDFTTGTTTRYALNPLHCEPLPQLSYDRQGAQSYNYVSLGWGNGILVYATWQFSELNIWSTAV